MMRILLVPGLVLVMACGGRVPCPRSGGQDRGQVDAVAAGQRGRHAGRGHRGRHERHGDRHAHGGSAQGPGGHHGPAADHAYRHSGHNPHHRFDDPEVWAQRFDDPQRDGWQHPDQVIAALSLAPGAVVADLGAGTGYFSMRLAAAVPEGRVWAVDTEPNMVRYLNARARRDGGGNVFGVVGLPDDPLLPEPVDLVLVVNTYHHIADRRAYFRALLGHLKPGGRLAIVDFKMGELPVGPPDAMKIPAATVVEELTAAGYSLTRQDTETLPHQYLQIFSVEP